MWKNQGAVEKNNLGTHKLFCFCNLCTLFSVLFENQPVNWIILNTVNWLIIWTNSVNFSHPLFDHLINQTLVNWIIFKQFQLTHTSASDNGTRYGSKFDQKSYPGAVWDK